MTTQGPVAFLDALKSALGDPYVYGAAGPTTFDCSGLIQWAMHQAGYAVPRTSEEQYASGLFVPVDHSDLQPGDLVFSQWPGDDSSPGHVAIYTGNGQIIEAPKPGEDVHQIALDQSYLAQVVGYRRFAQWANLSAAELAAIKQAGGGVAAGAQTSSDPISQAASALAGVGADLVSMSSFMSKLLLPSTWTRVGAGVLGLGLVAVGVVFMVKEIGASGRG